MGTDLSERDGTYFAARMTNIQFEALACRLIPTRVMPELRELIRARNIRKGQNTRSHEVAKWLVNGWSTERLLRTNSAFLTADALRHSLHWAFPQAYYAVFAITQAYFRAVGYTEVAHTSTIRKFGMEVRAARYPAALCCYADGSYSKGFAGLSYSKLPTSLHFDPLDSSTVDAQIAQFLGATRDLDLDAKKSDHRFKTKAGAPRKSLGHGEWDQVSQSLGPTSLLSLLYRKRIKANYRDIDTFLHPELNPEALYKHLLTVVGALNATHEAMIGQAMGGDWLDTAIASVPDTVGEPPARRKSALSFTKA